MTRISISNAAVVVVIASTILIMNYYVTSTTRTLYVNANNIRGKRTVLHQNYRTSTTNTISDSDLDTTPTTSSNNHRQKLLQYISNSIRGGSSATGTLRKILMN